MIIVNNTSTDKKNVSINDLEHQSQNIVNNLIERLRQLELSIENLRKENAKLKSEHYKDEKLQYMLKRLKAMEKEYYRGFPITENEKKQIDNFINKYRGKNFGAIGGAFTYKFTPTSIGIFGEVIAPNGESFTFKELS